MSLPPPLADPAHLEARIAALAALLDKAVAEVDNVMALVQGRTTPPHGTHPLNPETTGSADDHTG